MDSTVFIVLFRGHGDKAHLLRAVRHRFIASFEIDQCIHLPGDCLSGDSIAPCCGVGARVGDYVPVNVRCGRYEVGYLRLGLDEEIKQVIALFGLCGYPSG